jgi:hypothetical protein
MKIERLVRGVDMNQRLAKLLAQGDCFPRTARKTGVPAISRTDHDIRFEDYSFLAFLICSVVALGEIEAMFVHSAIAQ